MLNKAILMGRLTSDPELRHTASSTPVVSFTLAVNRGYAKAGTDPQTDFIDIVAWRSTAEFVSKYFHKGQLVAVCGSIQTRVWEDKQGSKRKSVEVVADEVHFAEPKRDSQSQPRQDTGSQVFNMPVTGSEFNDFSTDDGELPF